MEYRKMNEEYAPSLLGFGCMRFPLKEDGLIDEIAAEKMLDTAIAHGVTYIDTAFPYHHGESEPFVGRVLKKYPRESYCLTTKMPLWDLKTLDDAKAMFENQLHRLAVEYVDFYLLHAMDQEKWKKVKELGILSYCQELKQAGKIRNLGFSFHDSYEVFEEILTAYPWDFCQIQYNYIDTDVQAGERGYALAEKLHIPMVIMEPIKGGSLSQLPEDIAEQMKTYAPEKSISSWALRWVASHPNVKVVLSGMSTMEQVEDNLATFDKFQPLNEEEQAIIFEAARAIKSRTRNGCTGCSYCMPCPFGVDIPGNFRLWNEFAKYAWTAKTKEAYAALETTQRASNCKECGKCETLCPQQIAIRKDLKRVDEEIGGLL